MVQMFSLALSFRLIFMDLASNNFFMKNKYRVCRKYFIYKSGDI